MLSPHEHAEAIRSLATELTKLGLPAREENGWLRVESAPKLRSPETRRSARNGKVYFVFDGAYSPNARSCAGRIERFIRTLEAFELL